MAKMNGCNISAAPDRNDWVKNCDAQAKLYWAVHEIVVLLKIIA